MSSTQIFLANILKYYEENSNVTTLEEISKRINEVEISKSILKDWSSERTTPNLRKIDIIAYKLNVQVSELFVANNIISISSPHWKDNIVNTFYSNLEKYEIIKGIDESSFVETLMSYRSYKEFVRYRKETINLKKIDMICDIFCVKVIDLFKELDT